MTEPTLEASTHLPVFEHIKRRDWGLGIIAWDKKTTRGYLFENGQLRVLAQEFYSLMREVDRPHDEVQALYDCLSRELEAARVEGGAQPRVPRHARPAMSLDDQIAVFHLEYPGGFADPQWVQAQRGAGAKSRLSTHRDAAIAQARTTFGASELAAQIAQHKFRAICDDVGSLLRSTDLVPAAELKGLELGRPDAERTFALAVHDLLHGEAGFGTLFDRFLGAFERTLQRSASWQLATALAALVHPKEHICVRPTSFREQAKWMAPRLVLGKLPTAASYLRLLSMAKIVSSRLTEQADGPRDLMDIHDFIRLTTRPAAKKLLLGLKRANPPPRAAAARTSEGAETAQA